MWKVTIYQHEVSINRGHRYLEEIRYYVPRGASKERLAKFLKGKTIVLDRFGVEFISDDWIEDWKVRNDTKVPQRGCCQDKIRTS